MADADERRANRRVPMQAAEHRLTIYRAGLAQMRGALAGGMAPATAAWQVGSSLTKEFSLDTRERVLLVASLFAARS